MKLTPNRNDEAAAPTVVMASRGSNQSGMRAYNERLVLTLIRQSGAMAKADIARQTGLSAQTVSVIMRALEADGLFEKGDPIRGKIGQPSVPMKLNRHGAFFLGLKVGRRSLDLVLTDFLGHVLHRVRHTHPYPEAANVVEFTNHSIRQLLDKLPPEHRDRVAGLGIAMPFRLWDWAKSLGVDPSDIAGWRDRNIAAEIGKNWDFPVFLSNDASAACGAELVFGEQNKPQDFLYFFVGFFIGGGLVLDGTLFAGRTGNAAALGSLPITTAGGKLRQLVDVASLAALAASLDLRDYESDMIWDAPDSWSLPDDILDNWLNEASNGMAQAILASACVIDFECVVVDGWLPETARAELVKRTAQHLNDAPLAGIETPNVHEGTIGSNARSLGAASLPLSERFLVNRNAFLKG